MSSRYSIAPVIFACAFLASAGCGDQGRSDDSSPDASPEFPTRFEVRENDCSCPGLELFFDLDASFELQHSSGSSDFSLCWVQGPHHPDLMRCYGAEIELNHITIDVWDAGCAATPCNGTLSENGTSVAATCSEGLAGGTCDLVLDVPVGE